MMKMEAMEITTGDDEVSYSPSLKRCAYITVFVLAIGVSVGLGYNQFSSNSSTAVTGDESDGVLLQIDNDLYSKLLPNELFEDRLYKNGDFENVLGIKPPFWGENETCNDRGENCQKLWGPCYANINPHWINVTKYHPLAPKTESNVDDLSGYCRPGFLIIGQGKCGTSSLYHYLIGHPRVLPANEKQIHYFKYYTNYPFRWYLAHFPTTASFLGQGALMTGEASPGYLPYPDVAALAHQSMPKTRIICVGRNPLERAYSSYRYNYVNPAMNMMRKGEAKNIKKNQTEHFYMQHLFSFEEMVKAELTVLKECLAEGGDAITKAKQKWERTKWGEKVYADRVGSNELPLADIDGQCYGGIVSPTVPRKQWAKLASKHPEKILNVPNMHLIQALVGRSLYVYPLEWWYAIFDKWDIYFVCTEELRDLSGAPLNRLGEYLGLPSYNFSSVISEGMYNVGEHQGYDHITPWDTAEDEDAKDLEKLHVNATTEVIPLSAAFRKDLIDFFRPHNERLFKLTGRRCTWE